MEENKYEEALERAKKELQHCGSQGCDAAKQIFRLFPELENEDEKIRKELIEHFRWNAQILNCITNQDVIAWLEKQKDFDKQLEQAYKTADEVQYNRGYRAAMEEMEKQDKQTADCPQNNQDVNRPNGCITMEDFSGGEGFYKLNIEYLNKRQVEEIEEIVRTWNNESKTSNEVIKNCIGMCLTDVCEQRFKDYNTSLRDCLAWLEKVGKNEEIKDGNSIDPHFWKPIITDCGAKEKIQEKIIKLSHKEDQVWSEEDEDVIYALETILDILIDPEACIGLDEVQGVKNETMKSWLKSLEDRVRPQPKWSEEDEYLLKWSLYNLQEIQHRFGPDFGIVGKCIDWLKSLKDRIH